MPVSITKMKKQLLSKIDSTDLVQVEKVERYIDLVKTIRQINLTINKAGGANVQNLITERNRINSALLNVESSLKGVIEK